jgi:hypothetical protein
MEQQVKKDFRHNEQQGRKQRRNSSFGKTATNGESWLIYDPHKVEISEQGEEVYRK